MGTDGTCDNWSFPAIAPSPSKELDSDQELRNLWKTGMKNHERATTRALMVCCQQDLHHHLPFRIPVVQEPELCEAKVNHFLPSWCRSVEVRSVDIQEICLISLRLHAAGHG